MPGLLGRGMYFNRPADAELMLVIIFPGSGRRELGSNNCTCTGLSPALAEEGEIVVCEKSPMRSSRVGTVAKES